MQSDKRGRAETFVLEAAVKARSGTGPGAVQTRWAEPMMQRNLCEFGRDSFSAPLNVRSPQNSPNPFPQGFKVGPLRDKPRFEEGPGLAGCGIWVCNREWQQKIAVQQS